MYRTILFLGLLQFGLFNSCTKAPKPINPNTSKEARELLNFLYELKEEGKVLSGQHNYCHQLLRSTDSVIAIAGKTPIIWGSDFIGFEGGATYTRQNVVDEAIRQYKSGSIITLMYHQVKPFDHDSLGFARSVKGRVTDEQWKQIVTPGTEYHKMLLEKIDDVAGYLKQLQDEDIPVLWRPYHEMNGGWFWYGNRPGEEGFIKLWDIMYDRYVNVHKLNNLIWVWNANAPRIRKNDDAMAYEYFFPGIDKVDVLAADVYHNDYKQEHHDQLLELAKGKPIGIGECGILPTPEILEQQASWVWFMNWAGYVWKSNKPKDVQELYNFEKVINKE